VQRAEPVERPAGAVEDAAEQRFADRHQFGAVDRAPAGGRQADLRVAGCGFRGDDAGARRQTVDILGWHQEKSLAVEADHFGFDRRAAQTA
jgi:hypothetical protein